MLKMQIEHYIKLAGYRSSNYSEVIKQTVRYFSKIFNEHVYVDSKKTVFVCQFNCALLLSLYHIYNSTFQLPKTFSKTIAIGLVLEQMYIYLLFYIENEMKHGMYSMYCMVKRSIITKSLNYESYNE